MIEWWAYAIGGAVTALGARVAWQETCGWVLLSGLLLVLASVLTCATGLYLLDEHVPGAVSIVALGVLGLVDAAGMYIVGMVAMRRKSRPLW